MTTAPTEPSLDDLLAAPIDRDNFDEVVRLVYDSYTSVDRTHNRLKELAADLEKKSGEEARELTEKLGVLLYAVGRYEDAAEKLHEVRTRKNASHFLGRVCLATQREEEALQHLEKGRQGDDLITDVLVVEACCALRDDKKAEEAIAGHKDVELADLDYARGRVAEVRGDYGEAMRLYEAALDKEPEHARSLFRLALNCDLNGDDDRAMELYGKCVDLKPTYVGALMNLGILYEDHDEYLKAISCYQHVLAIEPRHAVASLYLKDAESSLTMRMDVGRTQHMRQFHEIFSLPMSAFELSSRSRSCLDKMDVSTLGALTNMTRQELLNEKNFGETSLTEVEHLLARYQLGLRNLNEDEEVALDSPEIAENLGKSVDELDLSTRCQKCMDRLEITTVGKLIQRTAKELLASPNFGGTSLKEIDEQLALLGLSLKSEE